MNAVENKIFVSEPGMSVLNKIVNVCPLCASTSFRRFQRIASSHMYLQYHRCRNCGFVFQSPQMDDEQYRHFYAENYRLFLFGQKEPPRVDVDIQNRRASHLIDLVMEYVPDLKGQVHVDIGCGIGSLMETSRQRLGCMSYGIELDRSYREYAIARGLDVYKTLDDWMKIVNRKAMLVTLSHVLEHISDPLALISTIRECVLSPEGYLLIEVPNIYYHPTFELPHVCAFSPYTLDAVVRWAGYSPVLLKKHGLPLYATPLYLTMLAKPINSGVTPVPEPPGLRFRRLMGRTQSRLEDMVMKMHGFGAHVVRHVFPKNPVN